MIFLFDRRTGQPLVPIEERPVPQSGVPGKKARPPRHSRSRTSRRFAPLTLTFADTPSYQRSAADAKICREEFAALRYDGIYTPPSLQRSLHYPSNIGGVNWGGAAIDPNTGILYANTNRLAFSSRLIPRHSVEHYLLLLYMLQGFIIIVSLLAVLLGCAVRQSLNPGRVPLILVAVCIALMVGRYVHYAGRFSHYISNQAPTPYLIENGPITDSHDNPCGPAPFGGITAINLNTLTTVWERASR